MTLPSAYCGYTASNTLEAKVSGGFALLPASVPKSQALVGDVFWHEESLTASSLWQQ